MKPNELGREEVSICGLDRFFERQEKAKLIRMEKTPDKKTPAKTPSKRKYGDKRIEDKENTNDGQTNRARVNLESTIISLHQQLHSLPI